MKRALLSSKRGRRSRWLGSQDREEGEKLRGKQVDPSKSFIPSKDTLKTVNAIPQLHLGRCNMKREFHHINHM